MKHRQLLFFVWQILVREWNRVWVRGGEEGVEGGDVGWDPLFLDHFPVDISHWLFLPYTDT